MASAIETLLFLRRGGEVTRYHGLRRNRLETVAEHSFGVAWICALLTNWKPSAELLLAALAHDAAEHAVGDIPSPTKRALGIRDELQRLEDQHSRCAGVPVPTLPAAEALALRLADSLDGMISCLRERQSGNGLLRECFRNYNNYVAEEVRTALADRSSEEYALIAQTAEEIRQHVLAMNDATTTGG